MFFYFFMSACRLPTCKAFYESADFELRYLQVWLVGTDCFRLLCSFSYILYLLIFFYYIVIFLSFSYVAVSNRLTLILPREEKGIIYLTESSEGFDHAIIELMESSEELGPTSSRIRDYCPVLSNLEPEIIVLESSSKQSSTLVYY